MKGRKPILCIWIPMASQQVVDSITKQVEDKIQNEYHVFCLADFQSHSKLKIELLGTKKLSKTKYQTILNAISK